MAGMGPSDMFRNAVEQVVIFDGCNFNTCFDQNIYKYILMGVIYICPAEVRSR